MIKKLFYIGLALSLITNLILGLCIIGQERTCADTTLNWIENIIPDEETAIKIAYIYIDENFGWEECEEGAYYDSMIQFNESKNQWEVSFMKRTPTGGITWGGRKTYTYKKG